MSEEVKKVEEIEKEIEEIKGKLAKLDEEEKYADFQDRHLPGSPYVQIAYDRIAKTRKELKAELAQKEEELAKLQMQ